LYQCEPGLRVAVAAVMLTDACSSSSCDRQHLYVSSQHMGPLLAVMGRFHAVGTLWHFPLNFVWRDNLVLAGMLTRPGKSEAEVEAEFRFYEAEARDVVWVIKTPLALQRMVYQYQEIIPSMAVTTVSMHYLKVNFNTTISYQRRTLALLCRFYTRDACALQDRLLIFYVINKSEVHLLPSIYWFWIFDAVLMENRYLNCGTVHKQCAIVYVL